MIENLTEAREYIRSIDATDFDTGIVLGTGLGALVEDIQIEHRIPYEEIPHFPVSTVEGHKGRLILGRLSGHRVLVMQGRMHYYEGYSMQQVVFPIRVMKMLGIRRLIMSNAAGGLNPEYEISDLMVLSDHISLLPDNPLRGRNEESLGPRFPDMSEPYHPDWIKMAVEIADQQDIRLHTGVYAAVPGPNLETPAEYKYLRVIGADAVGMSTVPENIVANHMGLPVFAVSVITDLGIPGKIKRVNIPEILAAAAKAEPRMTAVIKELLNRIA